MNLTKYFLQQFFSTTNNYYAYFTPCHFTSSRWTLTLATVYVISRRKKREHIRDSFRGKCSMIVPSFSQPQRIDRKFLWTPTPPQLSRHILANVISFEKLFHGIYSVRSSRLLCCNIFVGRPLYKNFSREICIQRMFYTTKVSLSRLYVTLPITWISNTRSPPHFCLFARRYLSRAWVRG